MLESLRLVRNVGVFDSVSDGTDLPLERLTLIYADNGRGKTTLGAILRSLATGDPIAIEERARLAAQHSPHVVVDCNCGSPAAVFEGGAWSRTIPEIVVFDDVFVDQNVYSGLAVEPEHRQNLHDLILGAEAVALNERLAECVARVEDHNAALRTKEDAIPVAGRGTMPVDEFCGLPARADIDEAIQAAERQLTAAQQQSSIPTTLAFDALALPGFDAARIDGILQQDLPSLDASAVSRVQAHLEGLGDGGEAWVADGMQRERQTTRNAAAPTCPFCAQNLDNSPVIGHYRAFFSTEYTNLKRVVSDALESLNQAHAGDAPAEFERAVRVAGERQRFWSQLCDVSGVALDTEVITRDWRAAREGVAAALEAKQQAPLEPTALADTTAAAIARYETHRQAVQELNRQLQQANKAIAVLKEQQVADPASREADLKRLRAIRARHEPATAALCGEYLAEKAAKVATEDLRDETRAALDELRTTAFPEYQAATNVYLERFSVGFRLGSVTSANIRGGSTCTYELLVNNTPVPVSGGTPTPGEHSFRNTLSSGDRSTLALAFFLASLDQDSALGTKIVVIDDPISSLDEHRALTTVQEIRRLAGRAAQVVVLSHSKPFLCRLWEDADRAARTAILVAPDGEGSALREWDVSEDCISGHDRRHRLLRGYRDGNAQDEREVAEAIRFVLERFIRVAYPGHFPPEERLGRFLNSCSQRLGTPEEILDETDTRELGALLQYANTFHHDTNQAWETEVINSGELLGFVRRTLDFTRRR